MALREQISHCLDFSLKTQPELCAENVQQVVFLSYITIHSHVELLNYHYYWFESFRVCLGPTLILLLAPSIPVGARLFFFFCTKIIRCLLYLSLIY